MDKKEVKGRKKVDTKNVKKENKKEVNKKDTNNKIHIKDKKKFVICLLGVLLVIVIVIVLVLLNQKQDISTIKDYSSLNASKYSEELLAKYQTVESKNKFLEDYDKIQGAIGVYIIDNSTMEEDSFTKLIKNIKQMLEKEDFSKLSIEKPDFWNGKWQIDDQGIVQFKFGSKDITPKWINDEELANKIIE